MKVTAKASIAIQKDINEVFESIVDPNIMTNYFICKSSGRIETGSVVDWEFPEFDDNFPVAVKEVRENEYISFVWDPHSLVEINLESLPNGDTVVRVFEEGHQSDEAGIKWAVGQSEGWANFLACMKAWLEYGIHLRKGAFSFM